MIQIRSLIRCAWNRDGVTTISRQRRGTRQGLTLVHFSAQLEPCLTQETTLHTLNTP